MFTKTSQKFGQWSDIRANTVYGLGFGTEGELNKFIEKFQEIKEATRTAATNHSHKPHTTNGSISTSIYSSNSCSNDKDEAELHALDLNPGPGSGVFGKNALSHQRSHSLSHLQASKVSSLFPSSL